MISVEIPEVSAPSSKLKLGHVRTCACPPNHISCISPKEWIKNQLGVWQFNYERRDVRDKTIHPAAFPIALAKRVIELFTHQGELVVDPFVGSGTTLVAARDLGRNGIGFDLNHQYIELSRTRLGMPLLDIGQQLAVHADARHSSKYIDPESVSLIFTSPPYANLLNRRRLNKSRRTYDRKNSQYLKVEQYSQNPDDLGTLPLEQYTVEIGSIFHNLLPLMKPRAHCVINVPDMWWENKRITIHVSIIEELRRVGYELRNIIIWDRTNIVNRIGIFGWPNNYITMGTTFEYLLDFWRPPKDIPQLI